MKQLDDHNLDRAKKRFYTSIGMLVFAIIYLISPIDLIPGPPPLEWVEDIPILIGSMIFYGYSYHKMKKERKIFEDSHNIDENGQY